MATLAQINDFLNGQYGITIQVNERRYGSIKTVTDNVQVEQNRFFPEDTFVMLSTAGNGSIGAGLWGTTPEELADGSAYASRTRQQYVMCTTWDAQDPVATWTKATGVFIPVIPNVYGHIIANVNTTTGSTGSTGSTGETGLEG